MSNPPQFIMKFVEEIGDFAARLDSTGWMIIAACSVFAGYALLRGPGIRGS